MTQEEKDMKSKADLVDKGVDDRVEGEMQELNKKSGFKKLMIYNNPKYLIIVGSIFSINCGASMPILGVAMSKMLSYLTAPIEYLPMFDPAFTGTGLEFLQ